MGRERETRKRNRAPALAAPTPPPSSTAPTAQPKSIHPSIHPPPTHHPSTTHPSAPAASINIWSDSFNAHGFSDKVKERMDGSLAVLVAPGSKPSPGGGIGDAAMIGDVDEDELGDLIGESHSLLLSSSSNHPPSIRRSSSPSVELDSDSSSSSSDDDEDREDLDAPYTSGGVYVHHANVPVESSTAAAAPKLSDPASAATDAPFTAANGTVIVVTRHHSDNGRGDGGDGNGDSGKLAKAAAAPIKRSRSQMIVRGFSRRRSFDWTSSAQTAAAWSDDEDSKSIASVASLSHPENSWIRVKAKNKHVVELDRLRLAQSFNVASLQQDAYLPQATSSDDPPSVASSLDQKGEATGNSCVVLVMQFSTDGRYLGTGGTDGILRVWEMTEVSSPALKRSELSASMGASRFSGRLASKSFGDSVFSKNTIMQSFGSLRRGSKTSDSSADSIFSPLPSRTYTGHSGPIMDIAWSKRSFLLSASLDRTVRLWHPARKECLGVFQHTDGVVSVKFHPIDERLFISGDSRLRIWSTAEKKVVSWVEMPKSSAPAAGQPPLPTETPTTTWSLYVSSLSLPLITAVAFTRDGSLAIAGTASGVLFFYETDGLRYNTMIEIPMNARHSKGPKILSIECTPTGSVGDDRLLVTGGDSRIRLFNLRDKSLMRVFKGADFKSGFLFRAKFSEDCKHIICGSDNSRVYFWNTEPSLHHKLPKQFSDITHSGRRTGDGFSSSGSLTPPSSSMEGRLKRLSSNSAAFSGVLAGIRHWQSDSSRTAQYECFVASSDAVPCTIMAPAATIALLKENVADLLSTSPQQQRRLGGDFGLLIITSDSTGKIHAFAKESGLSSSEASLGSPSTRHSSVSSHSSSVETLSRRTSDPNSTPPLPAGAIDESHQPNIVPTVSAIRRSFTAPTDGFKLSNSSLATTRSTASSATSTFARTESLPPSSSSLYQASTSTSSNDTTTPKPTRPTAPAPVNPSTAATAASEPPPRRAAPDEICFSPRASRRSLPASATTSPASRTYVSTATAPSLPGSVQTTHLRTAPPPTPPRPPAATAAAAAPSPPLPLLRRSRSFLRGHSGDHHVADLDGVGGGGLPLQQQHHLHPHGGHFAAAAAAAVAFAHAHTHYHHQSGAKLGSLLAAGGGGVGGGGGGSGGASVWWSRAPPPAPSPPPALPPRAPSPTPHAAGGFGAATVMAMAGDGGDHLQRRSVGAFGTGLLPSDALLAAHGHHGLTWPSGSSSSSSSLSSGSAQQAPPTRRNSALDAFLAAHLARGHSHPPTVVVSPSKSATTADDGTVQRCNACGGVSFCVVLPGKQVKCLTCGNLM
ncbi:hypothetical protein DFJ73DRAFT_961949 [Zopfochytrium polystomum]|nr:hypothetical protein DFJ73DRAFT_961949 [Zopfochytrium polystomum]